MFRKPKEEKHVYGTLRIFLRCRTVHTRVRKAAVPVGGHCSPHAARDSSDLSDMNLPGLDFRGHGLIPWGHLRPAYFTEQGASRRRLCRSIGQQDPSCGRATVPSSVCRSMNTGSSHFLAL